MDLLPLLLHLDAERAHALTLHALRLAGALRPVRALLRRRYAVEHPGLRTRAFGLEFQNPIGLAAGYDKDGIAMHGLACLGFGHLELGTVTPQEHSGNPAPRLFRLPQDRALINRLGFPNRGADALVARLKRRPRDVVVGANIGKGIHTPIERAGEDYTRLLTVLYPHVDYLAVNVSSPNTPELRRLQLRGPLEALLGGLQAARTVQRQRTGKTVPLLIKLAPDLEPDELGRAVEAILRTGMDGVILTNTTTDRTGLSSRHRDQPGGLSGDPLFRRSRHVVQQVQRLTGGELPIVGVGGVSSPDRARQMLGAGACLVQLYTGLVYQGPGLVRSMLHGLIKER